MAQVEVGATEGNVFLFFRGKDSIYTGDILTALGWTATIPQAALLEPMDVSSVYRVRVAVNLDNGRSARLWCKYDKLQDALGGALEGKAYGGAEITGAYLPGRTLVRR
jgi:hypothetical protein